MPNIKKKIAAISSCALLAAASSAAGFPTESVGAAYGKILINEVCAKNTTVPSGDGNCYDYVELYNATGSDVNIGGYGLTDDETKPFRFVFPDGSVIKAGSKVVVYLNSKEFKLDGQYTGYFGLSTDGETVSLCSPDGNVVDQVTFGNMDADTSFGRISDGSDSFAVLSLSPGESNSASSVKQKYVAPPVLSVQSGFYDDEFELTLSSSQENKIYYTLDSSTPSASSNEYTGALTVSKPQNDQKQDEHREEEHREEEHREEHREEGQRPEGDNHQAGEPERRPENQPAPNGEKHGGEPGGEPNGGGQAGGSKSAYVIRAVAVDSEGNYSEPVCGVYFIGLKGTKSYYQNVKVISIVTDSSNLYDSKTGIFRNYEGSGREWERPANLQLFSGYNYSYEQNVGIRIHGGYTRRFNQKSLNVYARSDYGASQFEYDLFSGKVKRETDGKTIKKFDSFILRNAGNDNESTRVRDKINQTLVSDRNFLTQGMEPAVVFINGSYYGHLEITEKVSPEYISSHLDVSKKSIVIIKNNKLEEGDQEDYSEFKNLWSWIKSTDFSNDSAYEQLCSKVDMECFADYMSSNIYIGNKDWGNNNVSMWKSNKIKDSNPYMDGRWRFNMFDTEYSAGMYGQISANTNTLNQIMKTDKSFITDLLNGALKNEKFRNMFAASFMDIANNNFSSSRVDSLFSEISSSYKDLASDTMKTFYGKDNFSSELSKVKSFFGSRYSNIVSCLKSTLKISGDLVSLTVKNDSQYGTVVVGTTRSEGSYTGKYFSDCPVPVRAIPKEGYEVAGWKLSDGKTISGNEVEISLKSSVTAEPVYVKEGENAGFTNNTNTNNNANTNSTSQKGDVNSDGSVNATDLIMIKQYLTGLASYSKSFDINSDGTVNILDMISLKSILLGE